MTSNGPREPIIEAQPHEHRREDPGDRTLSLRIRQQEILAELGVTALKGTPFDDLLREAVRLSAQGLEAEFCKVLEYMPTQNRLLMRAGVGWEAGLVGTASVGADVASPSGYALRTGKPVISNHLESEERFRTPDLLAAHRVRRAINVILQGDGAPYGVLEVDSRSPGEFGERDIAFLQGAANILGMAIERKRQEQALEAALERQQVLLKEINHRVKNSLQLVASMLRLQAGDDPRLGQRLQEVSSRIIAIGRAHDRLYRSPQIEKIEMSDYLLDLCKYLQQVTPNCDILFEPSGQFSFNTDQAIDLALIVTELVINAAKHAYPNDRRGPIQVCVGRVNDTVVRISVRDEGSGLAPNFEIMKEDGFGMRLVKALVTQTHGQLRMEQHLRGTEFVLEIPTDSAAGTPGTESDRNAD
jgi:two-component sensor histidine kinase